LVIYLNIPAPVDVQLRHTESLSQQYSTSGYSIIPHTLSSKFESLKVTCLPPWMTRTITMD